MTLQNILVIKLSALGDFIIALGAMKAIKHHHPNAKISLLTTAPFKGIAEQSGYFDEIFIDPRAKVFQFSKWRTLTKILNKKWHRVYDLQCNDRTGIYYHLMRPKPEWVGTAFGASHRNKNPNRKEGLALDRHRQTLSLGGINSIEIDTLDWMNDDISQFNIPKPYALIVPGCAPSRPEKKWPAEQYGEIAQYFITKNITPVIIGSNHEKNIADVITSHCPDAVNLVSKTSLFSIASLAREASISIGNDTGPMHIIGPTGCKTLALFSNSSDPQKHLPLGSNVAFIQEADINKMRIEAVIKKINSLL